eukprot:11638782-Alexandrium_andersonii.AAC.1
MCIRDRSPFPLRTLHGRPLRSSLKWPHKGLSGHIRASFHCRVLKACQCCNPPPSAIHHAEHANLTQAFGI